jgi:nucleoside-diphosphate-sugar epimerase
MKLLVTGAAGFIGSQVTRQLVAGGDDVTGLVLSGENLARISDVGKSVDIRECDLGDSEGVARLINEIRPEAAIHLAWYAVPGRYWNATENLGCVAQGMNLAEVLADNGCGRLVAAGTCAEYDWDHEHLDEHETPCRPRTLYGATKYALYLILERFCKLSSMEFAWLRYNFIYGHGEHAGRLVPSVIEKLSAGEDVACTQGLQKRDFLHVEDVASATVAVLKSNVQGAINIGSGEPVPVRKLVETLARLIGGKGRPLFGELEANPDEPAALVPDVTRLRNEVGWRPALELQEGLKKALDCWKTLRDAATSHTAEESAPCS